ncbi:MAG: substrate-binding domain-containing protein [Lentisphaerae bacterium]|nr:substrate-binding domain-containing protein [Lentisphaerota bacterium]
MTRQTNSIRITRLLNENRALLMLCGLFGVLSCTAPHFFSLQNAATILKGSCLNGIAAIGFTLIFILGQLDLSIGAVVMLCGMLTVGLQPTLGWGGSIAVSLLAGGTVGLVNGLLVVKARINSFIVTLGSLTIVMGLMFLYSGGGSKAVTDFRFADWLERPLLPGLPLMPPIVLITLVLISTASVVLKHTRVGRNTLMVGGNPETAWLAGLNRDRYMLGGFILCSLFAAIAGTLFAAGLSAMTSAAVLGNRTLMTVLAAVIIGGAMMTGGKGDVVKSYLAVLMLTTLFNGVGCFGQGFEVQIFINGLILAVVVLYEAYAIYRHDLLKGERPDLMREVAEGRAGSSIDGDQEGEMTMQQRDRLPLICLTIVAVVGVVAITAMYFHHSGKGPMLAATLPAQTEAGVDVFALCGTDGQPYILPEAATPTIPPRPANPTVLAESEPGHWWDVEFAGWNVKKAPMPASPGDGPSGKRIVLLKAGDHPYWTAYVNGFKAMANAYGMVPKIYNGNWNLDLQAQQTEQAINERPDMVVLAPVDATGCTPLLRRLNKAGIPCLTSNTTPCDEAMKYCLAWTGPDDWGQFRMLARTFADKLGKRGGYAVVRHMPGSSPFFARTYAPITELGRYAPEMKLLAMDTANLETEKTMQLVSAWLTKYGPELKGLILAGDGFSMTGTLEAVKKSGREDLIIVAAGNSKTGMDSVKAGDALAITYQSAEGDGAIAVHSAAQWFKGESLKPVIYLPKHIITGADVDSYMPAQW